MLKEASRLYAASWVRDIGPDLRPNDYKKDDANGDDKPSGDKRATKEKEPSVLEDLGEKSGSDGLKSLISNVHYSFNLNALTYHLNRYSFMSSFIIIVVM